MCEDSKKAQSKKVAYIERVFFCFLKSPFDLQEPCNRLTTCPESTLVSPENREAEETQNTFFGGRKNICLMWAFWRKSNYDMC